jgi:hypothetical protein
MSVVSESNLLRLVDVGVLPPKELCSWRICRGVTVPTEDTHESVAYVPFLIRSLALPISPFFRGLLDFYNLNLTHMNPNSILQISIFVHLCKAYLRILPHFDLWNYLYHCRPGKAGGQHQLVGGASLEMRRGRKIEYLDIPLKDSIKGWRLELFIIENHGKSLPPRSGRQLDVRTLSWVESPTSLEVTEARVLLVEICLLKERGLTAEAMVADFVFKNIQPLKDRAYPSYLYSGITDSTRVTNSKIPTKDLVSRLDMILRGKVSNVGAPVTYSAWNLPPPKSFFNFVSNPPVGDSGLGLRVRPSPEDIGSLVASLCDLPNDERQVHFSVSASLDDEEIDVVLNMLAGESSDSARVEPMAVAVVQELNKTVDTRKPEGICPKCPRPVSRPTAPVEEKKKKKRQLRRLSCLDQDTGPSTPVCEEVPAEILTEVDPNGGVPVEADPNGCDRAPADPNVCNLIEADPNGCNLAPAEPNGCDLIEADPNGCNRAETDPNGCDRAPAIVRIFYEDEEEEEEVPLIRKNNRRYRGSRGDSDIPSPALSALVSLQELSITDFDQALEDVIPEGMLSEPTAGDMVDVCSDIPDVGLEVSGAVSHASLTLEGSLQCQEVS